MDGRLSAGNTLACLVLGHHPEAREQCISWLPRDIAPAALIKFSEGGVANLEESRRWLAGVVQAYLTSGSDHLVVVEDVLSRRGDPVLSRLQSPVRYYRDEVYRVLGATDSNEFSITTTLSEAEAPHQLVCVFTASPDFPGSDSEDIREREIQAWATLASAVAVKAYDGEGYVFCALSELSPLPAAPRVEPPPG